MSVLPHMLELMPGHAYRATYRAELYANVRDSELLVFRGGEDMFGYVDGSREPKHVGYWTTEWENSELQRINIKTNSIIMMQVWSTYALDTSP